MAKDYLQQFYLTADEPDNQEDLFGLAGLAQRLLTEQGSQEEVLDNRLNWERWSCLAHLNEDSKFELHPGVGERLKTQEARQYLTNRVQHCRNPVLRARYAHLLWFLYRVHPMALIAIDSYVDLAQKFQKLIPQDEGAFIQLSRSLEQAILLSTKLNYDIGLAATDQLVAELIGAAIPLWMKRSLIEFAFSKVKKNLVRYPLQPYLDDIGITNEIKGYFEVKDIYLTAVKVDNYYKLGTAVFWYEKLGDGIRAFASSRKDDESGLVVIPQLAEAMKYYKLAGAAEKLAATALQLTAFKKMRRPFSKITTQIKGKEAEKIVAYIELVADRYLQMDLMVCFYGLTDFIKFLPDYDHPAAFFLQTRAMDMMQVFVFDQNDNPKLIKTEAKAKAKLDRAYHLQYQLIPKQIITRIMHELIKNGKLTIETLDEFFKFNWIGQSYPLLNDDNEEITICFYDYIRPSLVYYINQGKTHLIDKAGADFIVAIDALVLRFEFLLRNLLKLKGLSTSSLDLASGDLRENYLPEMLESIKDLDFFAKEDLQLMNYFYTKNGLDLRNKVAHGYMDKSSYTIELAGQVVWSIMRLGQFTVAQ